MRTPPKRAAWVGTEISTRLDRLVKRYIPKLANLDSDDILLTAQFYCDDAPHEATIGEVHAAWRRVVYNAIKAGR